MPFQRGCLKVSAKKYSKMSELNIVYIGPLSFPLGYASTKRRRYMVDYMNEKKITSHVLSTRYKKDKNMINPQSGKYGDFSDYFDISDLFSIKTIGYYYKRGKAKLKEWYDPKKKNILIFHTNLPIEDFVFFKYALDLGYKIVFDQVETSYIAKGTNASFKRKCYIGLCNIVTNYAYKRAAGSFVISTALKSQNEEKYPSMPLCILPNSTPVLIGKQKSTLSNPVRILYSGTYAPKDGIKFLIEGFLIAAKKNINCELVLVGKGNERDMQYVRSAISESSQINYLGFLSDEELIDVMQDCDILAMTRNNSIFANYGFPFKLSEYLATGNIVLATRVGDVDMYLKDQYDAYLIEPESAEQIANAIIHIIENPQKALDVAKNGFRTMQNRFSIENVGRIFLSFLQYI